MNKVIENIRTELFDVLDDKDDRRGFINPVVIIEHFCDSSECFFVKKFESSMIVFIRVIYLLRKVSESTTFCYVAA